MIEQSILEAQIAQITNEIVQLEARKLSDEMKLEDASVQTGNAGADNQLTAEAVVARNTIAMVSRMLDTRRAKLSELTASRDAMIAAAKG